ncbi:SDR family NAD(P)-dependent oxidoreductase [Asticcacaulis sp. SL142]|uniref:SDR family NAD(P)-dependent oxidoreductase n=1 Tax=Asticcacaulis sp. SL142 TaxID=2995155 RepID=UPI00226CAF20|nr:SDR family oxidoreductase [Asticcacaulis sp. SL142]WAC47485.1 SDR family NAD(P)-dependent oxidoreductase [Asticcacaulis sp. SL142]
MSDLMPVQNPVREPFNPMSLEGRTILVTGASSGIGKGTAIYLAKLGARVIASGRNAERLQETLNEMPGEGHVGRVLDLAQHELIVPWMKETCALYGPLNGLAHCAGIQSMRPLQTVNLDYIREVFDANLTAALVLAQAMRLKGCHTPQASLVFVASTSALRGASGNSVYAASKGGMAAMTRSLGIELVRDGLRVNCVAPALVDTPIAHAYRKLTEDGYQRLTAAHPLGIGYPEDVAAAVAFLLADTSRWITGSIMAVDGGLLA